MRRSRATRARISAASSSGRTRGVQHEEALRLGRCDREELGPHASVEVVLLGLEPVERLVVGVEAPPRDGRVEVEEHREVGQQAAGRPQRQVPHLVATENPAGALVGDRRVEVAVLDDDLAAGERGAHDGLDVVGAVGGVQQRLGAGGDLAAGDAARCRG